MKRLLKKWRPCFTSLCPKRDFASLQSGLKAIKDVEFCIAVSLWPQSGYPILKQYLQLAKKYYRTEITPVDYRENSESARQTINSWVLKQTGKKIADIVSVRPPSTTRFILTNAVYFKGKWHSQFKSSATKPMPFYVTDSESVQVPMMSQVSKFRYGQNEGLKVVELPYVGGKLSMFILLPDEADGIYNDLKAITVEQIDKWVANLATEVVEIYLPRFRIEAELHLCDLLRSMGMNAVFSEEVANFSGIDGNINWLYIAEVLHKAFIDVNEEGAEAAASTSVKMNAKSAPLEPKLFKADHPFLFLIRDNATRNILFLGRLISPTNKLSSLFPDSGT